MISDYTVCSRCGKSYDETSCEHCAASDIPTADLARVAFEAYGASTGGKTWDGKPIPPFDEVRARTPHVAAAWEAAVRAVLAAR